MKKVLVLLLVFGMASAASAALQISVHPTTQELTWEPMDPQSTDITIIPSEELILDIHSTGGDVDPQAVWLIATGPGSILSPGVLNPTYSWHPTGSETTLFSLGDGSDIVEWIASIIPGTGSAVFTNLNLGTGGILATDTLLDEVLFHCDDVGDVTITLLDAADSTLNTVLDTVVIHQIPEPITMALLGLGGLGLLRRRR